MGTTNMHTEEGISSRPRRRPKVRRQIDNRRNQEGAFVGKLPQVILQPKEGRQATRDDLLDENISVC
jgi:hypothetical protein